MNRDSTQIPASSQTVGPYFRLGLEYLVERNRARVPDMRETIEIRGRVLDREGGVVPDAMLEFWSAARMDESCNANAERNAFSPKFRRVMTDGEGRFSMVIERPMVFNDANMRAPHLLTLVFARGLLRHLITRVYLGNEQANGNDPVLRLVPEERRPMLIARPDEDRADLYCWDVVLQGTGETVFFSW